MKKISGLIRVSLFILGFLPTAMAWADCSKLNDEATAKAAAFYPRESYSVTGSGRLYFYSAPSSECREEKTFVIPGDSLVLYSEYKGWYNVGFFNTKTGNDAFGWVKPERLKYSGTLGPKN
ncbi:MAG: hypothetical protein U1F57_07755 [bacterium]